MGMDETTKSKIEYLIIVYAAHAKKAKKAHSGLADLVWKYLDKQDPQSSLDCLEEMIYLIPQGTPLLLPLYDRLFELRADREMSTVENPKTDPISLEKRPQGRNSEAR